ANARSSVDTLSELRLASQPSLRADGPLFKLAGILADSTRALGECGQDGVAPAKGTERRGTLVDLLVCLCVEPHLRRVPGRKLFHGDHELDLAFGLALLGGGVIKLRQ